jgi:hypothetical protein
MEALKKKKLKKMNRLYFLIILILCNNFLKAQDKKISLSAMLMNDSISVKISNVSLGDTVVFSLYQQTKFKKKWITSSYDVFCNIKNPNTTILIIKPNENLNFKVAYSHLIFTNEKLKKVKSTCTKCNRIKFIGNVKNKEVFYYSNTI